MGWITSRTATQLSGLPRKTLVELADNGTIRFKRRSQKGWRFYWREDVETLMRPPSANLEHVGDAYGNLQMAVRQIERAIGLLSDENLAVLAKTFPSIGGYWKAMRVIVEEMGKML